MIFFFTPSSHQSFSICQPDGSFACWRDSSKFSSQIVLSFCLIIVLTLMCEHPFGTQFSIGSTNWEQSRGTELSLGLKSNLLPGHSLDELGRVKQRNFLDIEFSFTLSWQVLSWNIEEQIRHFHIFRGIYTVKRDKGVEAPLEISATCTTFNIIAGWIPLTQGYTLD